jgi:predicted RNA binding protein YcfA (HicA-like mRNA interferase family)
MVKKESPLVRLKKHKTNVGFSDLVHVLNQNGYVEQSVKGSHHIFGKQGHLPIMIVKPHGGKKSCHPMDVNKVIKMLEALNED